MLIDAKAKLLAALDHAEEYRGLPIRANDRTASVSCINAFWNCTWRSRSSLGADGGRSN
jgi:hypothetical protein